MLLIDVDRMAYMYLLSAGKRCKIRVHKLEKARICHKHINCERLKKHTHVYFKQAGQCMDGTYTQLCAGGHVVHAGCGMQQ
jgi:hypothetical protein